MQRFPRGPEPHKILSCTKAVGDFLLQDLALHLHVENKMQNGTMGKS